MKHIIKLYLLTILFVAIPVLAVDGLAVIDMRTAVLSTQAAADAFKALEEENWDKIILVPILIIILTLLKGAALFKQTVVINSIVQAIIFKIQNKLYESF